MTDNQQDASSENPEDLQEKLARDSATRKRFILIFIGGKLVFLAVVGVIVWAMWP